jgi:hypothetical protein
MDVPDSLKSLILALEPPPLSSDTNAFPDKTYPDVGEAIINQPDGWMAVVKSFKIAILDYPTAPSLTRFSRSARGQGVCFCNMAVV